MAFSSWRTWVTGEVVTAAHMNQEVRDNGLALFPDGETADTWSPGLSATVTGAVVTVTGRQYQVGAMMHLWANFVIDTSGGSGTYFVTLPMSAVGLASSISEGSGQPVGAWILRDNSVPRSYNGVMQLRTADEIHFNVGPGSVSNVYPMQIQQDDELSFYAVIPVA
jgi:hypothetical protein